MNKHFVFVDDSWWDSPPCDCCRGGWVESWTCTSHEEIQWNCSDIPDSLHSVYEVVTGTNLRENDEYYEEEELEQMLKEFGITVEFVEQY